MTTGQDPKRASSQRLVARQVAAALEGWQVTVPDSKAVSEAEEMAFTACSPELYGHSARSYIYAAAIGAQANLNFDAEVLAVGCLLHDVGLTNTFGDRQRAFEVVSADAAAGLAERHHWALTRRYTLHRAMVLHMAPTIPPGDVTEVKLMEAGIACDVTGSNRGKLTSRGHRQVLTAFPRPNFAPEFVDDMQQQATLLPGCHASILMSAGLADATAAHQEWVEELQISTA